MATKKSSQPAGRGVKDEEVKTAYHDELLNWLIDNLAEVITDRWGMTSDEVERSMEEARQKELKWIDRGAKDRFEKCADPNAEDGYDRPLSDAARHSMKLAESRVPAVRSRIASIVPLESFGDAVLKTYEVMKRVSRVQTKSVGAGYKKQEAVIRSDAGYVDLEAVAFVPAEAQIRIADCSERSQDEATRSWVFFSSEDVTDFAEAFKPDNVVLSQLGSEERLWFSVRTGSFTLGEILQELKELSVLEDGKHQVALVVDGIDAGMLSKIEREGFVVVDRNSYR